MQIGVFLTKVGDNVPLDDGKAVWSPYHRRIPPFNPENKMNKGKIRFPALIVETQKGGFYRCHLQDNKDHVLLAHLCGKMRTRRIALCAGDLVTVELSPYDLTRGRIVWRH